MFLLSLYLIWSGTAPVKLTAEQTVVLTNVKSQIEERITGHMNSLGECKKDPVSFIREAVKSGDINSKYRRTLLSSIDMCNMESLSVEERYALHINRYKKILSFFNPQMSTADVAALIFLIRNFKALYEKLDLDDKKTSKMYNAYEPDFMGDILSLLGSIECKSYLNYLYDQIECAKFRGDRMEYKLLVIPHMTHLCKTLLNNYDILTQIPGSIEPQEIIRVLKIQSTLSLYGLIEQFLESEENSNSHFKIHGDTIQIKSDNPATNSLPFFVRNALILYQKYFFLTELKRRITPLLLEIEQNNEKAILAAAYAKTPPKQNGSKRNSLPPPTSEAPANNSTSLPPVEVVKRMLTDSDLKDIETDVTAIMGGPIPPAAQAKEKFQEQLRLFDFQRTDICNIFHTLGEGGSVKSNDLKRALEKFGTLASRGGSSHDYEIWSISGKNHFRNHLDFPHGKKADVANGSLLIKILKDLFEEAGYLKSAATEAQATR